MNFANFYLGGSSDEAARLSGDELVVGLTNNRSEPVSIDAAGVAATRARGGFTEWAGINPRVGQVMIHTDPALPMIHPARASLIWCVDSAGALRWERLPRDVADALRAVLRRVSVPDGLGGSTLGEIPWTGSDGREGSMADGWDSSMMRAALAVALDRAGGEIESTQTEFAAVRAKLGEYIITGEVVRATPGEPAIRIRLVPSAAKQSMLVS
jgi:hypothetical protein